jgi:hypothetical protein
VRPLIVAATATPNRPTSQVPSTGLGAMVVYDARLLGAHPAAGADRPPVAA